MESIKSRQSRLRVLRLTQIKINLRVRINKKFCQNSDIPIIIVTSLLTCDVTTQSVQNRKVHDRETSEHPTAQLIGIYCAHARLVSLSAKIVQVPSVLISRAEDL